MISPSLEQVISTFRTEYQGPKIAFFIAGGGFSALDFRRFPGTNRLYHTAIEPYNRDTANFLTKYAGSDIPDPEKFSFVNPEGTHDALRALSNYCGEPDLLYVVINSACTTDRWRRGDNRAYITTSRGDMFIFQMNKLEQQEYDILSAKGQRYIDDIRFQEDRRIAQVALAIIMNDVSLFPKLEHGEFVQRMHNSGSGYVVNNNDILASC